MACLSDIDLATLHRSRLEERFNYKLSFQQPHHIYEGGGGGGGYSPRRPCLPASMMPNNVGGCIKSTNLEDLNGHCAMDDLTKKLNRLKFLNKQKLLQRGESSSSLEEEEDYNYFSSTTRRRRSGTWPRTRSLNAPSPFQQFGPCGRIMKNPAMVMQIQDPASQRLTWYKPPLTVLVIKKVRDSTVMAPFVQLVEWLVQEKHMVVWVESAVLDDLSLQEDKRFQNIKEKLVTFKDGRDDLTDRIDFIVCLGGDGTLLYASLLFQQSVPPVMAFHLGSLGFLTPFQFDNFQEQVTNVLEGHAALTLRSRLRCVIYRKSERRKDSDCQQNQMNCSISGDSGVSMDSCGGSGTHNASGKSGSRAPSTNILVLNEVVIDRGPSPYLSNIDLFLDGKYITSVQGDGLIVSTPTGSTAYAVAAGASMIHPSVPAIMVTPICPHSLSFRPIVVPAGVELKISVSPDSRNTSWVSFDGRNRQELFHGDSLRVTTSIYPVPSICAQDQISDWFDSLAECLHWNVRKKQKCLDELSDLTASGSEDTLDELERGSDSLLDS
ncbi:NAD kinase isoform X1 [Musca domestica]|uniref:NAD(+) kinase n=3 Tax=Musca domestica TaxID=7370 RepID=A0A1I8M8G9_MUSDO|nr:NAD kinase isoform X1 [Musca domestica]